MTHWLLKAFSGLIKTVAVIGLLLIVLSWGLLGTRTGLQWLVDTSGVLIPGTVTIKQIKGNLFGRLELFQLTYQNDDLILHIDQLVLIWNPAVLLKKTLEINNFQLQEVYFKQLTQSPEPGNKEPSFTSDTLTEINLPFKFKLEHLSAQNIEIVTAAEKGVDFEETLETNVEPELKLYVEPVIINEITLAAQWYKTQLEIDKLQLRLPDYALRSSGTLHTDMNYPLDLLLELHLAMDGLPEITTAGTVKGDLQQLTIKQHSIQYDEESLFLDSVAQLEDILSDLHWSSRLEIRQFPLGLWVPDSIEKFNLVTDIQGDLAQLQVKNLKGTIFKGSVALDGELTYSPLAWQTNVMAEGIDPAGYHAEFPGHLDLNGRVNGQWHNDQLQLGIDLQQLSGTLREQAISGRGEFKLIDDKMSFSQVSLGSGKARANIHGELGKNYSLQWELDIPDLNDLLPDARGVIQGQGKITGSAAEPFFMGQLQAHQLNYQSYSTQLFKIEFDLNSEPEKQSKLTASAKAVVLDKEKIDSINLQIKGPLDQHVIELSAQHEQAELHMRARGGYKKAKSNLATAEIPLWQGDVEKLDLSARQFGWWKLVSPARLELSQERVKLAPLCLQEQQTELCSRIDLNQSKGHADINLKGLSLSRLLPYLPEDITQLDGMLGADLKLDIGRALKADLNAVLESGTLTYLADASHQVRLHHQGGDIKAHLGDKQLAGEFKLSVGEHGAHGNITVPRKTLEKDAAAAPLNGNIFIQVKELGLLTAFVPEIQQAEGSIVAQLKLHGVLAEPRMSGHATLASSQIHIPAAGINLKNTHFEIIGKGSRELFITGQSQSGDGMINLNGKLTLDAEQNWPVQLALSGNHFLAVNLPQAQILVIPELEIKHHQQGLVISGKITIPEAEITPRTIPMGSYDISPDVVIISAENPSGEPQTSTAIDARITLILGNKVYFNGFGLKAHLAGQMTVQQKPHQLATANGGLTIVSGSYRAIGQNLTIEQGRLSYAGGHLDNPGLNFRASREVQDTTVGISMSGTLQSPKFTTFSSEPGMSSSDTTSMLLTGQTLDNVDQARFYAGRDVTQKLSVGVNAGGGDEGSEFVARYKLWPNVHVEATSSAEKSGGKILYTIVIE